jgi:hypothetical protein
MKIIITEEQLKLIVENEGEDNLIDFTPFYKGGIPPEEWDKMFLHLNKKKGGKYTGYYIGGNVDLEESNVTQLKYLVRVEGYLSLNNTPIKLLPMLSYVGASLDLYGSQIESLPKGLYVGGHLYLRKTPLSKVTTIKELRSKIEVEGRIQL